MENSLREALTRAGCADEKLIQLMEREWSTLHYKRPQSDLARMVTKSGRDLGAISTYLQKTFGLNKKCAAILSREFADKISDQSSTDSRLKLGITLGIWRYANFGENRCDHQSLDGRRFSLKRGIRFNGKSISPGEEMGCQCTSTPVIEGFIDDVPPEKLIHKVKRLFGY